MTISDLQRTAGPRAGQPRNGWLFVSESKRPATCRVYQAETAEDFAGLGELWKAVYGTECGWLDPAAALAYKDRYDPHATYLMATVDDQFVGTMRLVADSAEGLPVEQFVSIGDLRGGERRLVECQRLMILPQQRNRRWPELPYGVLGGLVKGSLHWCIMNGFSHILADVFLGTRTTPMNLLLALGFTETGKYFVDTELNEADHSTALLLRVGELFSRPFRTTSPFYRYLMEYESTVDIYD
jgi:N-acyl-L-homoserine lactone synthetase